VGANRFRFTAIVEPLTGDTLERAFVNTAAMSLDDARAGVLTETFTDLHHRTDVGYNSIAKDARLVAVTTDASGAVTETVQAIDNGLETLPVPADRAQTVLYTLTVTRRAAPQNLSGQVEIVDMLPQGMTLVEGSLATDLSGATGATAVSSRGIADASTGAVGVEFVIAGLRDGHVAKLSFRAKTPQYTDDPTTEQIETERTVVNQATVVDGDMAAMVYPLAVAGRPAGEPLSPTAFTAESNRTYHPILGALLTAVKSTTTPAGARVSPNEVLTYRITVTNTGKDRARNVLIKDKVPGGMDFVTGSAKGSVYGPGVNPRQNPELGDASLVTTGLIDRTVTWIVSEIPVGGTAVLEMRVKVVPLEEIGTRVYTNVAYVKEGTPDGDPAAEITEEFTDPTPSTPTENHQVKGMNVTVRKLNSDGDRLEGAVVAIRQITSADPHTKFDVIEGVTNEEGECEFADIPAGTYEVFEVEAPEGYALNPIRLSVVVYQGAQDRVVRIVDQLQSINLMVPNMGALSRNVGDCAN
jgi:uncharacterized repeat protein (TIGR01451 family)